MMIVIKIYFYVCLHRSWWCLFINQLIYAEDLYRNYYKIKKTVTSYKIPRFLVLNETCKSRVNQTAQRIKQIMSKIID